MTAAVLVVSVVLALLALFCITAVVVARQFDAPRPHDMRMRSFPGHIAHNRELRPLGYVAAGALAVIVGAVALLAWAVPSSAATITAQDAIGGPGWRAAVLTGETLGRCGSGGVVIGDGCSPVTADGLGYGQDMPGGQNSQDTDRLGFTFSAADPFDRLWIQTRDARDQAASHWIMELEGATAELLDRRPNGETRGWLVTLDRLMTSVSALISTRHNDGFSMKGKVCREGRG